MGEFKKVGQCKMGEKRYIIICQKCRFFTLKWKVFADFYLMSVANMLSQTNLISPFSEKLCWRRKKGCIHNWL